MLLHRERARAAMDARGLDALIATSPENVTYASGYGNWTIYTFRDQEVYALVPREGPLALVVPIDAADYLAQVPVDASRLYTYGTFHTMRDPAAVLGGPEARLYEIREHASHRATALDALRRALTELDVGPMLGIDERGMPPSRWRSLAGALPGRTVTEAHDLFRTVRSVKTDEEVERLRAAAHIVERGMLAAFRRVGRGVTEADLEREFRTTVASLGATPGHFETSAGTRSAGCFPASIEYRIQAGDVVRSDCGGRARGYWADTGRTAVLGAAPLRLARYAEALEAGITALLEAIEPGVPVRELFRIGVETVRAAGIPHYRRHHVGHAIGLEFYEAPLLADTEAGRADGEPARLEPGMVINIELPYYELGLGGLQIEDTLVIRPGGYELLTSAPRGLLAAGQ